MLNLFIYIFRDTYIIWVLHFILRLFDLNLFLGVRNSNVQQNVPNIVSKNFQAGFISYLRIRRVFVVSARYLSKLLKCKGVH